MKTLNTCIPHCHFEAGTIGTFSLDKEDRLFFQAGAGNNFLLEAYGLTPVKARVNEVVEPVAKPKPELSKTTIEEVTRALPVVEKAEAVLANPVQRKSSRWVAIALMGIMAVTAASLWRYTYTQQVQRGAIIDLPLQQEQPAQHEQAQPETQQAPLVADSMVTETIAPAEEQPVTVAPKQAIAEVAVESTPATSVTDSTFYIIGGAFARSSNADKFVIHLRSKGYQSEAVDGIGARLRRVSYAQYSSRNAAEKALVQIQQKENPEAWVLALP